MELLESLFPGLSGGSSDFLPKWANPNEPWTILFRGPDSLQSQIVQILENEDESYIHPTAKIGECVTIEGPSFVGPGAVIRHGAYLRKGSWVGEGALVGHSSEVKNSILLPGSKAPHFNYVGDSILGFNANLGAGAKISNVRNDRRNILLTLKDGSRVDSGCNKLGSMIGDGSQIGCNVVANPGTMILPNSMIGPNETLSGWIS